MRQFRREKYQIDILSEEYFNKWITDNPQYKDKMNFQKWKRYWKYVRDAIVEEVIAKTSGVDLPLFLGNLSIKILDIDFKCHKDYISSPKYDQFGPYHKPDATPNLPKKAKIAWKKHKLFSGDVASSLGMEAARTFKTMVGRAVRNRTHVYEKACKHDGIKSKCEPEKPYSLYDIA